MISKRQMRQRRGAKRGRGKCKDRRSGYVWADDIDIARAVGADIGRAIEQFRRDNAAAVIRGKLIRPKWERTIGIKI